MSFPKEHIQVHFKEWKSSVSNVISIGVGGGVKPRTSNHCFSNVFVTDLAASMQMNPWPEFMTPCGVTGSQLPSRSIWQGKRNIAWMTSDWINWTTVCAYMWSEKFEFLTNTYSTCHDMWIRFGLRCVLLWFNQAHYIRNHQSDVIMSAMASQITGVSIVC